jgi:UDP-glucuronate 4-epimerase
MNILVTGCSGFIGYHLINKLLDKKHKIIGIDNLNNYYSVKLKLIRLNNLKKKKNFLFYKIDIKNRKSLQKIYNKKIDLIINLAAQAGVQYSFKNPKKYLDTNVVGFFNILEFAKEKNVKKIMFASSSSIYGSLKEKKFSENMKADSQISLYASTKKMNENLATFYANNFKMTILGMRFFTVYGSYGRPDMSYFKFSNLIRKDKHIELYNNGKHARDFTYIDDCIKIVMKLLSVVKSRKILLSKNYYDVVNVACGKQIKLNTLIKLLEKNYKKKIKIKYKPLQKGDVKNTFSDTKKLKKYIGNISMTKFSKGIKKFCKWYIDQKIKTYG